MGPRGQRERAICGADCLQSTPALDKGIAPELVPKGNKVGSPVLFSQLVVGNLVLWLVSNNHTQFPVCK